MRIKELFTVPDGEKVTEKVLGKVLISSVCSILLCMACLVSTTWAWFAVSIENEENVIQIATVSETVTVTDTDGNKTVDPVDGVYALENGRYKVHVQLASNATGSDDLNKPKTPVYVLMSADTGEGAAYYYFSFAGGAGEAEQVLEIYRAPAVLRFSVTWVEPDAAMQIGDEAVTIGEKPTVLTEMPTTAPTTVPEETAEATEEATVPPSTQASTVPVETSTSAASDADSIMGRSA